MADGSKLIQYYQGYKKYQNISISKSKIRRDFYPAENRQTSLLNYKLKKNSLIVSKYLSYEIDKIAIDTLVIIERIKDIPLYKSKRYHLVKKDRIIRDREFQYLGKSHIQADPLYTPKCNENIELALNTIFKGFRDNLKLKGTINLLIKKKKIDTKIKFRDKVDPLREPIIVHVIDSSFASWDVSGFEKYDRVSIDFVLNMEKTNTYRGIKFTLHASTFKQQQGLYGIPLEIINESGKEFRNGINFYSNNEFEKAIESFTKAYEINPTLIDALYNRAASHHILDKVEEACKDWKTLMKLEQVDGANLFNEKCSNPNQI